MKFTAAVAALLFLSVSMAQAQSTSVNLPSAPSTVGAKASFYTDPVTGKKVYRLSDRTMCPHGASHFYSYVNQFSPQGRMVFMCQSDATNANVRSFPIYAKDYTLLVKDAITAARYTNSSGAPYAVQWPQWSQVREVLYGIEGGRVIELDPFTGTNRVAADFLGNVRSVTLPTGATVQLGAMRDLKVGPGDRLVVELQCLTSGNASCPANYAVVAVGVFDPATGRYTSHVVHGTTRGTFDEVNITQNPFGRVLESYANRPKWTYNSDFGGAIQMQDGHGHMGFVSGSDGRHYVMKVKNDLLSNGSYGQMGCVNSGFSYWKPEFGLYDDATGQRVLVWGCDIPGANDGRDHFARSTAAKNIFAGSDTNAIMRFTLRFDSTGKPNGVGYETVANPRTNGSCGYWASPRAAMDGSGTRFMFGSSMSNTTHASYENGVRKTSCTGDVYVAESSSTAPASPILAVSPTALSFSATQGGANPAAKTLSISNAGGGTLSWTAASSTNWLSVSPSSGSGAATLTVSANSSGLAAGTYNGTITAAASGAQGSPVAVPVTLAITSATITVNSLAVSPNPVTGGAGSTGTVTLSGAAPSGGRVVALASNKAAASVPASVTVPAGSTSASFAIATGAVTTQQQATISATLNGAVQAVLVVNPPATSPVSVSALTVNPSSVTGGATATATVTLSANAPTGGVSVALASSSTSVATLPTSVSIAAGARTANVTVQTFAVTSSRVVTLTATLNGSRQATLTVNPAATEARSVQSLSISPSTVIGGSSAIGTVTLSGAAPAGGATVALSSNTSGVGVPLQIVVPSGAIAASFTITTTAIDSRLATITATLNGSRQATLQVNEPVSSGGDTVPPTIRLLRTELSNKCRLSMYFSTSDNVGAVRVEVWAPDQFMGAVDPRTTSVISFSSSGFAGRNMQLTLRAKDAAGNTGSTSFWYQFPKMTWSLAAGCKVVN